MTFANQTSDGTAVVVDRVAINATKPPGGFVVYLAADDASAENITENDTGERLGNSTFLEPGEHENATIELNRTLAGNRTLVAVVHSDATGNELFDPEGDQPLTVDDEIIADAALVNVTETDSGDAVETERDEIIGPHFRSAVSTAPITALVDRG